MGYYCTVPQCTSLAGKTKNVKFHRFPRDVTMADKWNLILKRGKPYTKYSKVCSLHFTQADYNVTTMGQWKTLSKDAVPSQNLPKLNADGTVMVIRKSRTVKYRDGKKEDATHTEKTDNDRPKYVLPTQHIPLTTIADAPLRAELHDANLAYRLSSHSLNALVNTMVTPSNIPVSPHSKPKKQDAIMQTDPVQSEEDDTQNTSYENDKPFTDIEYQMPYSKDDQKSFDTPKDYTKSESDYIPQTNEEYNSEAEKYALERKAPNSYEKAEVYKTVPIEYQKLEMYPFRDPRENWYQNYPDSAEVLRNQQHNLQMLQEQHRVNENQNFFNESHIKQEVDINAEDDKFLYERSKEQLDANSLLPRYESRRPQPRLDLLQHHVKQEPEGADTHSNKGCENVLQPQGSPYYATNGHSNVTSGYYENMPRPGPELLIAKQNALAAHSQLWSSNSKPPFCYTDRSYYNTTQLFHRHEDVPRILQ